MGWVPAEYIPVEAVEVGVADGGMSTAQPDVAVTDAHDGSGQNGAESVCLEGK